MASRAIPKVLEVTRVSYKTPTLLAAGPYLVLDYLYCDASNYKAYGSAWFSGTLSNEKRYEIIECLSDREFFVAEQVGFLPLYPDLFAKYGGPTDDDHPWHRFEGFRDEPKLIGSVDVLGDASSLVLVFVAARQNWHPEMSKNFYL